MNTNIFFPIMLYVFYIHHVNVETFHIYVRVKSIYNILVIKFCKTMHKGVSCYKSVFLQH